MHQVVTLEINHSLFFGITVRAIVLVLQSVQLRYTLEFNVC